MTAPRWRAVLGAAALASSAHALAAESIEARLEHCAGIAGDQARLGCYDALAGRSAGSAQSHPMPITPPVPRPAPPAMAADATAATVAPVTTAGAATVPSAEPAEASKNFGLSSAQRHSAPEGPQSIEARVRELTMDRGLRSYVALDNGQTWTSTDGGMELNSGEQVVIKRAALGSFMLVSTESKHSYHVRRVR